MAYNGLTNIGAEYLAKCIANKTGVTFTKIKVGNGAIPGGKTGQTTTDLYGFKKEVEILAKEQVENAIKLTVLLNNIDLAAGFYVKEMGIYIQDGNQEKLYWYINKDNPSYLPDKNTPANHRYNLYLEVTPVETTVVNFTGQDLLADKKYVDDSIKNFQDKNDQVIENLKTLINGKEPTISKKTGFNLDKSDSFIEGGANTLATSEAVKLGNVANMGVTQNGAFPLTSATVGSTYRASNGKLYRCIIAYSGNQISVPNENFEELSIWENSNRLTNLVDIKEKVSLNTSNEQRIIKIGTLKLIFGICANESANEKTINYIEPFKEVFGIQITPYGNDTSSMRINSNSITTISFKVVWQQFSGNDPILWIAFGI